MFDVTNMIPDFILRYKKKSPEDWKEQNPSPDKHHPPSFSSRMPVPEAMPGNPAAAALPETLSGSRQLQKQMTAAPVRARSFLCLDAFMPREPFPTDAESTGYFWTVLRFYLFTLAPSPPMTASTSSRLAMVVSPGVVMARAPWAAPYSTALAAS